MRYILTYTETKNGAVSAGKNLFNAPSDSEATEYAKNLLKSRNVTDITLWRRGDFVILGRESI